MPKGGHNAKSIERHKADGTYNATKHKARLQAKPETEYPEPPEHYDAAHLEKWLWLCEQLQDMGILGKADRDAMRMYCDASILALREHEAIMREGTVTVTKAGTPMLNPRTRSYKDAYTQMRQLFAEFGLTPLARMRMKSPEKPKEEIDPLAELFDN